MKRNYDKILTNEEKENIINEYTINGLSIKKISQKYDIKSKSYISNLIGDKIRNSSEANKIAHKKYPENFKHTKKSKEKIRDARLKYMKEHPEKTAWRLKNESYPEKKFEKMLIDNGIDKKHVIVREYSVFPYFIDFAFVDLKLAIEIDGSQHLLEDRRNSDEKKDNLLLESGWKVVRITANEVINNIDNVASRLIDIITCTPNKCMKQKENEILRIGIQRYKSKHVYIYKERDENGYTEGQKKRFLEQRKTVWPTKEELENLIYTKNWCEIGRQFNVTDNAVRKWCKNYGLPYRTKDIKK